MSKLTVGISWTVFFVVMEAFQFVYFGGIFQKISSFLFGFLVFGIVTIMFVGGSAIAHPNQLSAAFRNSKNLIGINVSNTFAWAAFFTSVQLIEPAVVYTISAGVMPITAFLAYRFGFSEGHKNLHKYEIMGMILLLFGIIFLAIITIGGHSGFVRGGSYVAAIGVLLAIVDGILFTIMLIYSQRLDKSGVGPTVVFGLRFPLYVLAAGGLSIYGVDAKSALPSSDLGIIVLLGLILTVPHLFALQKALTQISTPLISTLTTLGPFIIFLLQIFEGRVEYSSVTLIGLFVYFAGAMLSVYGLLDKSSSQ